MDLKDSLAVRCERHLRQVMQPAIMHTLSPLGDLNETAGVGCPLRARRYSVDWGYFDFVAGEHARVQPRPDRQCSRHSDPVYMFIDALPDGTFKLACPVAGCPETRPFNSEDTK